MYQLNAIYYSIATSVIEDKKVSSYVTLEEAADTVQNSCASYFAMRTPTPKEVIYYIDPGDRMGDLVEVGKVAELVVDHKGHLNNEIPLRIDILHHDHVNKKRNTLLASFTISKVW